MSISLDGFVAGPDQSQDNPIGRGGLRLHEWHINPEHPADVAGSHRGSGSRARTASVGRGWRGYSSPGRA